MINIRVKERLNNLVKREKVSLRTISRHTSLSYSTIYNIYNDKVTMSEDTMRVIKQYLDDNKDKDQPETTPVLPKGVMNEEF